MKKSKTEVFIQKAKLVHGDKYDYSKVEYINNITKVCIICPEHGEFWQTPKCHLKGQGCKLCYHQRTKERLFKTNNQFIEQSNKIHNCFYDYSKVEYNGCFNKVCIICPIHGEFWQKPQHHLSGCGCTKCRYIENGINLRRTKESFVSEANVVHNYKYDYSQVEYKNIHDKVCIICPIHGEFYQTPLNHLQGHGCSKCNSSKMENIIRDFLLLNKINSSEQEQFNWLYNKRYMRLDFYLPDYNIAIECQGEQHFTLNEYFGGSKGFEYELHRDQLKYQQCKEHNIEVIYYFPEDFLKYDIDFYKDKKCFHNVESLKKYLI